MRTQMNLKFRNLKENVRTQINNPKNFKTAMNVFMVTMFVLSFIFVFVPTGYATTFTEDIKSIAFKVYGAIAAISTSIAAVGITIAALLYFFSSNGKTVESASAWIKRIIMGWVFINAMGIIISFITSIVGTSYQWKG